MYKCFKLNIKIFLFFFHVAAIDINAVKTRAQASKQLNWAFSQTFTSKFTQPIVPNVDCFKSN